MADSFAACRDITRRANSSFLLAFRLLSPPKRRAMDALYAFSRVTDDLADEPGEPEVKRENLQQWRAALGEALAGRFTHPIHAALHDTVHRYEIPTRYLFDVIDGVEMDLEPVRFETFDELYPYCYRVASAVGLACVRIWGVRPGVSFAEADAPAEAAGIAFQLTNILRDLGEDAACGRVYLPRKELVYGSGEPLLRASDLRFQVQRARQYYRKAESLDSLLGREGRAIFRVMCGTYRALLEEIEKRDFDVFSRRVQVPRWRKGLIFLSAWPIRWGIL
jgi:phytoene synthase